MAESRFQQVRRRVGVGFFIAMVFGVVWLLSPGLPVFWGPRASSEVKAAGQTLFEHQWQPHDPLAGGDGLGPVFNARSCAECHFQGGIGGGGDNDHNVLAFEAHPTMDRPQVKGGLIHKFAVENRFFERTEALRSVFPVVPGAITVVGGCQVLTLDFDPVSTLSVNTTSLFGDGWIDRISGKSITNNHLRRSVEKISRELDSDFGGVVPGRPRVLAGGRVGKFGWKAQFATLDEFVAAACANELGLGNPRMDQAKPMVKGGYPAVEADLNRKQFRELVAFVDTLPRPEQVTPKDAVAVQRVEHGKSLFAKVGCAACHTPDMGGVAGIYSDFLLHRLDDTSKGGGGYRRVVSPRVPPLPHEYPQPEEWKTQPLWGVADSAPYFHDGGSRSLEAAIIRHQGDAVEVTAAYESLASVDRDAIIEFLQTLKAPADAAPAATVTKQSLASKR